MSVIRNGRNHMTIVARAWDPPAAGKYVLATRKPLELGAAQSHEVLKRLASGASGARVTKDAQRALKRLSQARPPR